MRAETPSGSREREFAHFNLLTRCRSGLTSAATIVILLLAIDASAQKPISLSAWERGVKVSSPTDPKGFAHLWFYEWHMFSAVMPGEHTRGNWEWQWQVNRPGTRAVMNGDWLKLTADAKPDGAELKLEIENRSDHDWPEIAGMIPCFNPGNPVGDKANPIFLDLEHDDTWFVAGKGFELIKGFGPREIHFNQQLRSKVMKWTKERKDGKFVFSEKWPTSDRNATYGLMVRESETDGWVMGIGWERFLSAQGHNPWRCMHLSVNIGPLKRGQKQTINGRIFLFKGTKEDCLTRFNQWRAKLSD
jgi:hypothetical protein